MAKYDAAGDKVRNSPPAALWIMLAGVVIAVIGFIWCMNTDLKKYAKTENLYTDQNTTDVKNLEFDFDGANVDVVKSGDSQIHVSIENAPEGIYKYGIKDNKFYISRKKLFSLIKLSGISKIPFLEDIYPTAKIKVAIPDSIKFDKIEIDSGIGDLVAEDLKCEYLDIENGIGELTISNCTADKTKVDNGIGETTIKNCSLGNADIDNGIGEITAEKSSFGEMDIDNGIGEIELSGEFKGDVDIENGIGDIELRIDGDSSDYKFSGDSKHVKISGGNGSSNGKYKIKTDNGLGDIKIKFI